MALKHRNLIPRPDHKAIVVREKRISKEEVVLVPVMLHDNYQAAVHWLSGQAEVEERGEWAGYATKDEPA